MSAQPIHATAVALQVGGRWRGVLLRGPSGSGKSDLALSLIARGARLVGDDYVHVWASSGAVYAAPAARIAGRIEARGLGIVSLVYRDLVRLALIVDCVQETPERLPEPAFQRLAGIELPVLKLDTRPASAVESLTLAISRL